MRQFKSRFLSLMIVFALLLSMTVFVSAETASISATSATVDRGGSYTIVVSLAGSEKIKSGSITVEVPTGLTVSSGKWTLVDADDEENEPAISNYTKSTGKGTFSFNSNAPANINGAIFELKIKVNADASFEPKEVNVAVKLYTIDKVYKDYSCKSTITVNCPHANTTNVGATTPTCQEVGYTAGVKCNDCGQYISGHTEIAKVDHTYENNWTSDGEKTHSRVCKVCGLDETKQTENHDWNDGVVKTAATHTTTGVMTYTCKKCGATKDATIDKLTEHTFTNWTKDDDTTHTGTCACGETLTENHTWGNGVVSKTATCIAGGELTFTCTKCGATKKENTSVDPTNHTNTTNVAATTPTCQQVGYTAGIYCNDCNKYISGHTEIAKTAHTYNDTWTKEDAEFHYRVCKVCGLDESKQKVAHSWNSGVVTKEPSHLETGIKTYTCTVCNATKEETLSKTEGHGFNNWVDNKNGTHTGTCACTETLTENHTWDDGQVTLAATCSATGTKLFTCTKCGATREETLGIDATNHTNTTNVAQTNPTCSSVGYTAGVYCNDCQKYISGHTEIAKTAHTYDNTWTSDGATTHSHVCKVCGLDESKVTENHTFGAWTKTSDTQHERTCKCGAKETEDHTWNNGVVTTQPTHLAEGEKTFTCTKCSATKTEKINKTTEHTYTNWTKDDDTTHTGTCACGEKQTENHTWNNGVVTTAATHLAEGVKTYTCTKCGATKTEKIDKTTTHTFGAWTKISDTQHERSCACGEKQTENHTWNNGVVTTAATHLAEGVKTFTCTKCSATKTEKINKTTEHTFVDWTKDDDTTHTGTCACGEKQTENHTWNNGEVTTVATHLAEGVKTYTCTKCGATKTEKIEKIKEHTFGAWTKVDDDKHERVCACGEKETADHSWDNGKVTKQATHLEEGVKTYTCSVCNGTKTETIDKTPEHTFSRWKNLNGNQHQRVCECGEVEKGNHVWEFTKTITEATCAKDGKALYTCSVCGTSNNVTIKKTDKHTFDNDCDPECNVCGLIRNISHVPSTVWSSDGTSHWHECTKCHIKLNVEAHKPGAAATNTTPQTCTVCGYIITPAIGHTHSYESKWTTDETSHWHKCTGCNEIKDKANHLWDKGKVTKESTETVAGEKVYTCSVCQATKTEKLPLAPKMTLPDNTEWKPEDKADMTFKSEAELKDFISVEVDGREVDRKNYDLYEGSTVVVLHEDFLKSLSNGTHEIKINSKTGTAKADFKVANNDNPSPDPAIVVEEPTVELWVYLLIGGGAAVIILLGGAIVLLVLQKKKKIK